MNYKILTLTLILPLTIASAKEVKSEINQEKANSFTLNLSNLDEFNFTEVESNVFIHKDGTKTIKIITGKKGIQSYINDLEQDLSEINFEGESSQQENLRYETILNDIDFYTSKLSQFDSKLKSKSNSSNQIKSHVGACQIGFTQDYHFNNSFFSRALVVTSSYPRAPGPFPPVVPVTIHAISEMNTVTTTSGLKHSYSDNTFMGNNINGGTVSAVSAYNGGLTTVTSMDWRAVSTLSKSNCFEYIDVSGSFFIGGGENGNL